jgi:hypothetical protein
VKVGSAAVYSSTAAISNERNKVMKAKYLKFNTEDLKNGDFYIPGGWVASLIQAITAGVTGVITGTITIIAAVMLFIGGLWLAYLYLPVNVFTIILVVIVADIALGVILRALLKYR